MSEESTTAIVLRSANRVNDSTFDRLWKYYYETKTKIELKPKEEEIRLRLKNIWGHLGDILTDRKAVQAHMEWCEEEGFKISERTAYEDLKYARMLFGDRTKQSKEVQRAIMSEILLDEIRRCVKAKKHMSAARLIKEYNELNDLKNHAAKDPLQRRAITIVFDADEETLRKQAEELMKDIETIDISYQDAE